MTPFLLILSAPSGGGKTTVARALLTAREDVGYSISLTTRPQRPGEKNGVDYHFVTAPEFEKQVQADAFVEWAEYGGFRYGTLRSEIDRRLAEGVHVVLDIDVQGARQIRERCENVVSVFIIPPTAAALIERLGGRDTEESGAILRRLRRAVVELEEAPAYDYVVVNEDKAQAVAEVAAIIDAEARRPERAPELHETLAQLAHDLSREVTRRSGPEE